MPSPTGCQTDADASVFALLPDVLPHLGRLGEAGRVSVAGDVLLEHHGICARGQRRPRGHRRQRVAGAHHVGHAGQQPAAERAARVRTGEILFAEAAGIRYQDKDGGLQLCHTTSWGVSTRMIGGVIMVHGDDDGLRCPPQIAPQQVVIVPMLRDNDEDAAVIDYARALASELRGLTAFGEPVRVLLDTKAIKASNKRWAWVKKGAPLIVEVGPRDVAGGNVAVIRRDRLYTDEGKLASAITARGDFVAAACATLEDIQSSLYAEAKTRLDAGIRRDVTDLAAHFAGQPLLTPVK